MKHAYFVAVLFAAAAPGALAIDLNTDALKTMQQQGDKIIAESKEWRNFELKGGRCMQINGGLNAVGANLVIRPCKPDAKNQQFRLDGNKLVGQGDTCVGVDGNPKKLGASAVMQKCGDDKAQQWTLDDKGRLANKEDRCLQATGNPSQKQANVISTNCNMSDNQIFQ